MQIQVLAKLPKCDLAAITGMLAYEVSETNEKGYFNLVAFKVDTAERIAEAINQRNVSPCPCLQIPDTARY